MDTGGLPALALPSEVSQVLSAELPEVQSGVMGMLRSLLTLRFSWASGQLEVHSAVRIVEDMSALPTMQLSRKLMVR